MSTYSVGEVAGFAGVTVRTMHHYDEIGLLSPSGRTPAGYRQYDDTDLERLQRILVYREMGLALDKIAAILDDPDTDPVDHLRRHYDRLTERAERLQHMVAAVKKTMEARQMGINLTPDEMFEVFGDDPTEHAAEAEERWGDTDAYRESQRRTSSYSKADWLEIQAEGEDINNRYVAAFTAGAAPDSEQSMAAAEAHRRHISRWFYDCSPQMHRGLGEMYVADPRFTAYYEKLAPGLAQFVRDAVTANADREDGS